MTTLWKTDYDQLDSINPPRKLEPKEASAVTSGGSQNMEHSTRDTFESADGSKNSKAIKKMDLEETAAVASYGSQNTKSSTWDTFRESTDGSKQDKENKEMLRKAHKGLMKPFKSSDHVHKKNEKHADENDEQTSEGIQEVPQDISGTYTQRTDCDQLDSMNPPGELEPKEVNAAASVRSQNTEHSTWDVFNESTDNSKTDQAKRKTETEEDGAVASGGSQNTNPSTWDTFGESTDSKQDKENKGVCEKAHNGLKKAFKCSDHVNKNNEKHADKNDEQTSGNIQEVPQSPQKTCNDQLDSMNLPGEPEFEKAEASAVASGGSQNTELSTWDTISESTDYSKKEKKKTFMFGKTRKGLKKAFKSSDQWKDIREVPHNISGTKGKHKLPVDEEDHRRASKKGSPELARQLYESKQYKKNVRVKASQVVKVKEELLADFKKLQDKWKTEHAAFQSTIQEYQTGFIQLKQKVNFSKSEMQRLSQANKELKNKESEMQRKFEVQVSGLETKNQVLTENLARSKEELIQTQKSLDQVTSDAKFQERELKYTQEKNASLKKEKLESSQTIDMLKADVKYMNGRMQNSEDELKKVQAELKTWTEEVLSFSKDKNESLVKFHNALKREKSLQVEKMKLDKQILSLTKRLEQMVELEQTIQEHTALQKTAKQWECMLEESRSKLEEERKHSMELQHLFDMKKQELQQTKCEYKEKKKESEILQARVEHLENQLEHFNKEYQSLSQKLEQERSKLTVKHQEEMKVLMLKNAEWQQQLRESMAIYEAAKQVPPHVTKKIDDSISISEQIPSEVAQELQLLKPVDTKSPGHLIKKQKSVELLTENSIQVTEDNITDAIKLNIQQEVTSLQQIVQPLQEDNEKLRSELEALKIERDKLSKIKEKYFSLVSERADIYQKLNEAESQSKASDEQTAPLAGPDVEMSLVATDINICQALGGLSMEIPLQDKDMKISGLKAQHEHALSHARSKNGLDQVETSLREEHVDLKKSSLSSRFMSVRKELTRVQSQNSDVSMENEGLLRDIIRLEEENLQLESEQSDYDKEMSELRSNLKKAEEENSELKMHAEILSEELESLKRKCGGEGHKKSLTQAAELKASRLEIALKDSKNALQRKDKEIKNTNNYVAKLEDCLQQSRQERDRQHKQITKLLAINADLMEELHVLEDNKQLSHDFEEALVLKNAEVSGLQQEKAALLDEIQSYKEEIEHQKLKVSYLKDDYEAERKDRENVASKMDDLTRKWTILAQELNEKIEEMKEQCYSEKNLKENAEFELQQASEKWNILKQKYEQDIVLLTNQVEELQTNMDGAKLFIDQCQKEFDAKLHVAKTTLLKEKQEHLVLKEKYENNNKKFRTIEAHFTEEKLKLLSQQQTLEMQFQETKRFLEETKQHFAKEMDQSTKQIQSLNLRRRAMSIQLEEEKQKADERLGTISKLSRDISTKDHMISQYEKELQSAQDHLQRENKDSLQNYVIRKITCTDKKIGAGSYGSISLVIVNGMPCIEKRLHDILVGLNGAEAVGERQQRNISEKFLEECRLLCKMSHPNIVQFIGIHYSGEVGDIRKMSLIMEYLPTNAEECITKCNKCFSLSIKISILRDVTYGLAHLHAHDIIHRDLSAANILITDSMRAKIADLGVSKLLSPSACTKLTKAPGANYIMPPEALNENPKYSNKLDVFSFGIFLLYLISQKEPSPQDCTLKEEHVRNKEIQIGKRINHIQLLQSESPGLESIALKTLQDEPDSRPTAANLCKLFNEHFQKVKDQFYGDLRGFINSLGKILLTIPDY